MNELYKYRFIPQNYIAEEILIGIILIYPNLLNSTQDILKKEYFFLESNQIIYLNLIEIYKNQKINIIELFYLLESRKLLNKIGGLKKIINMMKQGQIFIYSSKINNYIEILIKLINNSYIQRLIIQYGYNITKIGHISKIENNYLYNKALSYLTFIEAAIKKNKNQKILNIKDLVSKKLIEIKYQNIYDLHKINKNLILSGLSNLDKIIKCIPDGNLIIIAGRPSIGKTSLAINIAYNVFFNQRISICIFSLEMSNQEILNKLISIACQTEINEITIKKLNQEQWKKITKVCNTLLQNNIYINDQSNIDIEYIEEKTVDIKKKNKQIKLIIIDYLQLIEFSLEESTRYRYNRSQELGYITRKLKLLSQFLQLPIIVLSQLNRNIDNRNNKEPLLSDLKESGCIKYTNNMDISSNSINQLNIINIKNQIINLKIYHDIKYNKKINNNKINSDISIFQEYIFRYELVNKSLLLTSNHKYLSQVIWIKSNQILLSTTINSIIKEKFNIIKRKYIQNIISNKYSKSYDINKNNYFNIVSKEIILHNSIEQDADIILMLYKKQENINQLNNEIILDLKISKNRNGNTGYCKLLFIPQVNIFQNTHEDQIKK
uniref:DNA 5'-3' helicase n=1 Tax=Thaumatella adunca TaxID=2006976 RepID=A0A1Z1MNS9_9FLOR|nr:Replication helicase subunit [Thaumatella adunca]ARW67519.1 Replication helicase subunit [Thaumatella adunca]